jgi:hypothetical protein
MTSKTRFFAFQLAMIEVKWKKHKFLNHIISALDSKVISAPPTDHFDSPCLRQASAKPHPTPSPRGGRDIGQLLTRFPPLKGPEVLNDGGKGEDEG